MRKRLKMLISMGPTREPLDPVRYISNYSTGTMGLALARAALSRGHRVTLAMGDELSPPQGLKGRVRRFHTALDLKRVLTRETPRHDVLFMTAAVADFRPREHTGSKIKKSGRAIRLSLVENPDVLKSLRRFGKRRAMIGFTVESAGLVKKARGKLRSKNLDLVVAQKATPRTRPFGRVPVNALIVDREGREKRFRRISKGALAEYLIRRARSFYETKNSQAA